MTVIFIECSDEKIQGSMNGAEGMGFIWQMFKDDLSLS